jgi:virulence-associated protein VapD
MKSKISKIYKEIQEKRDELFKEIEKFREKYGFELQNGKIVFNKEKKEENKKEKTGSMRYML